MKKLLIFALKYTFIVSFALTCLITLISMFSEENYEETKVCEVKLSISKDDNEVTNTYVMRDTCHAK